MCAALLFTAGCSKPPPGNSGAGPQGTPGEIIEPAPTPSPTPPYIPNKQMDVARLFNGMQVTTTVTSDYGSAATAERAAPSSYALELKLNVKVPVASGDLASLSRLNDQLPALLPGLEKLITPPHVSPYFDELYRVKVGALQRNIARLDALLSRHNFYDCETILELEHPATKRRALLIQADMDVDSDGSDSDRVLAADGSSPTFQSLTSYRWPKKTAIPNPFLATREEKLKEMESAAAAKPATREQREAVIALRDEIDSLKRFSSLIGAADPFIVLPESLLTRNGPFAPRLGDYCVVLYKGKIYPAVVGDAGPGDKIGEASLRISKEINPLATSENRPVSELKVTYIVFPRTGDKPFGPPDLPKWHARCEALLNEMGGFTGELHAWEDLTRPAPTPTPVPTATPTPVATPAPASVSSGTGNGAPTISPPPVATGT